MEATETMVSLNPFPGLRSFEEDEDYLFFGRERQVDELLKKLGSTRFLAVIGASGSGKSSLVKCGLIPSLHSGIITKAGSNWRIAVFRPGNNPIGNMAEILAQPDILYGEEAADIPYRPIIESTLRRSDLGLIETTRQSTLRPNENLLIVVDQFEELFRFSKYEKNSLKAKKDSLAFIRLLLTAYKQKDIPIYIVLTMRSDFLGDCTEFIGLPEAINEGQYLIPRMRREEIRMAITGPIAVGGAEITPLLLSHLLNDTKDNPDQLPILQHALMRTWYYWKQQDEKEALDLRHYEAIGKMSKALSQHAEEAYEELGKEEQKNICKILFKSLTDKISDGRGTRRPTKLGEIAQLAEVSKEALIKVIDVFRKPGRSFLMPPHDVALTEDSVIDISHESLMRIWIRLVKWTDEEAQSAETYLRLAEAAERHQDGKGGLWRNPELEFTLRWQEEHQPNQVWATRYDPSFERAISFLDHSKAAFDFELEQKEKRQKRRLKRSRMIIGFSSVAAILFLFLSLFTFTLKLEADKQQQIAQEQKVIAEEEKVRAEENEEEARKQQQTAEEQKAIAEQEKTKAEQSEQKAVQQQEIAIMQRAIAEEEKTKAEQSEQKALEQQQIAEEQKGIAEQEKTKAEENEAIAQVLRDLAESRNQSFNAIQLLNKGKIAEGAKMAVDAHKLNRANDGPVQNNDNYQALLQALWHLQGESSYKAHRSSIRAIAVNKANGQIASGDESGAIHILNIRSHTIENVQLLKNNGQRIRALAYSPDGQFLVAGTVGGTLIVWDVTQGNSYKKRIQKNYSGLIGFTGFIKYNTTDALVFHAGKTAYIAEISGQEIDIIEEESFASIAAMAVSKDGTQVLIGTGKTIYWYTVSSGTLLDQKPFSHQISDPITALAVSNKGRFIAAGMHTGRIYLLKQGSSSGKYLAFHQPKSKLSGLTFSSGKSVQLASSGFDQTARLLDVEALFDNRKEDPIELKGHDKWVHGLSYSRDGNHLITIGEDHVLRIWPTQSDHMAVLLPKLIKTAGEN